MPKHVVPNYYATASEPNNGSGLPNGLKTKETNMAWTTPTLVEICIGLEINGYLPAEF